jgi:EAL domain-containing protein (putative c-di-GMP-specific phosphodiesterase class I)
VARREIARCGGPLLPLAQFRELAAHRLDLALELADFFRRPGLRLAGEWVESEADAKLLVAMGVDYFQRFFLGEPEIVPSG